MKINKNKRIISTDDESLTVQALSGGVVSVTVVSPIMGRINTITTSKKNLMLLLRQLGDM